MRDRTLGALALASLLAALPAVALDVDAEYKKAAQTILCDCGCHPQSTYDCACGRAEQMRAEILAKAKSGKTGDEVIAEYVSTKGEGVRIVPTSKGFNLFAWLLPGFAFFAAVGFVVLLLRRWRRSQPAPSTPTPGLSAGDPYAARLARELEEYE